MDTTTEIRGVLPVVQTPFTAAGEVDAAGLRVLCGWVLDQGTDGLTTGMVSEVLRLSTSERIEHNAVVSDVARSRQAMSIASCGAESTHTAVLLAREAERAHAGALMAIPPTTVGIDDTETLAYFAAIFDAVSIPVVVQDASGYVGRPLSIAVQAELLARYGDRAYFKPETPPIGQRLSALRDATSGAARIIEGTGGAALLDSFRRGIVGTMPGSEICWALVELWRSMLRDDFEHAYELSTCVNALVALQMSLDAFVAVEKHLLVRQGVLTEAHVRGPVAYTLDGETRDEVDRLFDRLHARTYAAATS